jgi:hypothetical protein
MRKLILEIEPNESMRKAMEPLFEKITFLWQLKIPLVK